MTQPAHEARKAARHVEQTDREVARAAGSQLPSKVVRVLGSASEMADQPPLIALSAATIVAGLAMRNARLTRTGLRMLASHGLATAGKSFVKHRVDRTRPFVMLKGRGYHARKGHSDAKEENSFPSGHTAGAVAIARSIAADYPAAAPAGYAAAALAGSIQVPRGAHYLSDVVVGAIIGLSADALVRLILPGRPAHD